MNKDDDLYIPQTDEKVYIANVYNPVKYMLKNAKKRTLLDIDEAIDKSKKESKEGGTLHRDGVYLKLVEGDRTFNYFLYYNERGILNYFVTLNKITGFAESWTLHYKNNMLIRYDYNIITHGLEEDSDDSDAMWDGWGTSIDPYL